MSAEYRTDSGESGSLNPAGGALIFKKAIGSAEETYYLTYTAKINEKTVTFQYVIQYKEVLDVKLSFSWLGFIDYLRLLNFLNGLGMFFVHSPTKYII